MANYRHFRKNEKEIRKDEENNYQRSRTGHGRNHCESLHLSGNNINILDISQTIIDGYFNMMMITDTSRSEKKLDQISTELAEIGKEIGVVIHAQHEDIFTKMHRI